MAIKTFLPLTPSLRFKVLPKFDEVTKVRPEKSLTLPLKRTGGRNNQGRLTSRHRGGGHKKRLRIVDFRRRKLEEASVLAIEYDPNRSARIALLEYVDKEKAYILAPVALQVGQKVAAGVKVDPTVGNALPLRSIPLGTPIHNIELVPARGAKLVRSAGVQAFLANREGGAAFINLASGEMRKVSEECFATIGRVGNVDHMSISSGKAGRSRWLGRRPHVRGVAMNPVDHPMGGGQGKSKGGGGRHHPVSPWGQLAKGFKTRRKHKPSSRFIVQQKTRKR